MALTPEQRIEVLLKAARFEEFLPADGGDAQFDEAVEKLAWTVAVHPNVQGGDLSLLRVRAAERFFLAGAAKPEQMVEDAMNMAMRLRERFAEADAKAAGVSETRDPTQAEAFLQALVDRVEGKRTRKKRSEEDQSGNGALDFEAAVEITDAVPPVIRFTVTGKSFDCCPGDLASAHNFSQKFFSALYRYPKVPSSHIVWKKVVNAWMEGAKHVELPADCSPDVLLREHIVKCVRAFSFGESIEDLDRGVALLENERTVFKTATLFEAVRTTERDLTVVTLGRALRDLGFEPKVTRFGKKTARIWVTPSEVQPAPEKSPGEDEDL